MNQYPLWKYLLIVAIIVIATIYALPNLYGENPAIQVSLSRAGQLDPGVEGRVEQALQGAGLPYTSMAMGPQTLKVRFASTDVQLRARDAVQQALGNNYTVALNLLPATPAWLRAIGGKPMYLGLDLQGGVHFLMQVDMHAVAKKTEENYADDLRRLLREKLVRYTSVRLLDNGVIEMRFRDASDRDKATQVIGKEYPGDLQLTSADRANAYAIDARISSKVIAERRSFALDQNMTSLRNRVNELGVAEPIVQQQGDNRIVVELPGVQDTAEAKRIIGRTATLEVMMVDEDHDVAAAVAGQVPPGDKLLYDRHGNPVLLKDRVIYSGEDIENAAPGFDSRDGQPIVSITLDSRAAAINQRITGENVGKRMAVVYVEVRSEMKRGPDGQPILDANGQPERVSQKIEQVITAPVIKEQLGKRFQIEGLGSVQEANDLALLLRAGALAAPISIIEERTIGPSLGRDNIDRGFHATVIGFTIVVVFMALYYQVFGLIADLALALNVVLVVAILSLFQATLTLPGIAGILLTVGMAVDANVLIYERIREELRLGNTPQASIHAGYAKAFGTIVDAHVTTLVAAIMLFNFGTGPIKGFAVTLTIGIVCSMFTAIMVSRAVTNLAFGGRRLRKVPV